jgi:hypothetical protein
MRDETRDETRTEEGRPIPAVGERRTSGHAGATVSIPPRTGHPTPFGPTTLHARLALLRPQPVRLRPARETDE